MKRTVLSLGIALALTPACSAPKPEPEIASSAGFSGYATSYPTDLGATTTGLGESEAEIARSAAAFDKYPGELKPPPKPGAFWAHALEIAEAADQAGRAQAYADRLDEVRDAQVFLSQEKDEITRKVGGAAQYAVKQKGCDVDVTGPIAHAFKESVDDRLEKHLRDANEAQRLVDRYRDSLGKEGAAALERQADEIALASYLAHIEVVEQKLRLQRMVAEAETIKKSQEDAIEAERKWANEATSPAEKKAAEERIAAMKKAQGNVDAAVTQAKAALEKIDERVANAKKTYEDAFEKLRSALKAKAGK